MATDSPRTLLVLYASVQSYVWAQLRTLCERFPVRVELVHWPLWEDSPFQFGSQPGLQARSKNDFSGVAALQSWARELQADAVFAVGRLDPDYLPVVRYYRQLGRPTLSNMDNQWQGSLRQWLAVLWPQWAYGRYYSHLMPAGLYQWEYARRLGYSRQRLLRHCYCADLPLFHRAYRRYHPAKRKQYPRRLLYVGRLAPEKGIDLLCEGFRRFCHEEGSDWELWVVGNGPLREQLPQHPQIRYWAFLQPEELRKMVAAVGAFCLPSRSEPWGVVLHEFAAAGLPVLASWEVGAASAFLEPGLNGFFIESPSPEAYQKALQRLTQHPPESLWQMGRESHRLSYRITLEQWAAEVYRLFEQQTIA